MKTNNHNTSPSFGIFIPLAVKSEIIKSIPQNLPPQVKQSTITHIKKVEAIGTDVYTLALKQNPVNDQPEFILRPTNKLAKKYTTIRIPSKNLLVTKFLNINEQKITEAIEKLKKSVAPLNPFL